MSSIRKYSLLITIISYIGVIIGYINKTLLFPNYLTPDQVGLANVMINIAIVFAQFSMLGVGAITLRFFPYFNDRARQHHGFLFWGSALAAIGSLLMAFVFLYFDGFITTHFGSKSPLIAEYYLYLIPLGISTTFYLFFDSFLRSIYKSVVPVFVNEVLLRLLITICILLYAINLISFHQFVIIYVIVNSSTALILLAYIAYLKQFTLKVELTFRIKKLYKKILIYGGFTILTIASGSLILNMDSLLITGLMDNGLYHFGIYSTVFYISSLILMPYRALSRMTSPLVAEYWRENDLTKMEVLYKKVSLINTIIGGGLFIVLWVNIDNLLSFLPMEYRGAQNVFLFVALGRLFDMITGLNGLIISTSRKYKYEILFSLFFAILTFVSCYVFIVNLNLGIDGAALATMLTIVVSNLIRLYFVQYNFKIQPFSKAILIITLIGAFATIIIHFIPTFTNVYMDGIIRSMMVLLLFVLPIYLLKLSHDFNSFFDKYLKRNKSINVNK
ncbi:MAG: oligosaccharide flippase family protein [Bacteroidetes bacterium]|nr:oligosaccharide flippase family protein [Bacteroidota bacterium]